jgi:prepilin-type N-terminal cleavage/methylation domain-containing protein
MEEKIHEICRTIWSFFNSWRFYKFIFPRSINSADNAIVLGLAKTFPKESKASAGFTLVEILVVIAIIGVIAAGFITILNPANHLKGSRDSKRKSDLRQIQTGLELYRADNGIYPGNGSITCGGNLTSGSITYISNIPCDPRADRSYSYNSSGSTYTLDACLERDNDPDGNGACGSGIYYTVRNP